jgi:hypothetical protein
MPLSDEATMVLRILIGRQYVPVREVLVELGGCMGRFASAVDEIDEFIELAGDDISNYSLGLTLEGRAKAESELMCGHHQA